MSSVSFRKFVATLAHHSERPQKFSERVSAFLSKVLIQQLPIQTAKIINAELPKVLQVPLREPRKEIQETAGLFVIRLANEFGVDPSDARDLARAYWLCLKELVDQDILQQVLRALPKEYELLFVGPPTPDQLLSKKTQRFIQRRTEMSNHLPRAINHVIVGVDFSDYSHIVVKQAQKFAVEFKAKLTIVFVRDLWMVIPHAKKYSLPETAIFESDELLAAVKKVYPIRSNIEVSYLVEKGEAADCLIRLAKNRKHALIVVGSLGSDAIGRFFLGSIAEKLALHSPHPVWIHKGNRIFFPKKTLIPIDLSKKNEHAIEILEGLFSKAKLKIDSLFVEPSFPMAWDLPNFEAIYEITQDNVRKLNDFQNRHPNIAIQKATGGAVARKIIRIGKEYDFLTMAPYQRSDLPQSYGSNTLKVIRHAKVPVLVLNAKIREATERKRNSLHQTLNRQIVYDPYYESH